LQRAGAELIGDYRGVSVTGLVEAFGVLRKSWQMLRTLGDAARERRPDVFVAVDFPDFNFRLLPVMHKLGIPVVYYVSPQLWAWRAGRLQTIKKYVAKMLVIFPFEQEMYEQAGVPVEFVGHPLVDLARATHPARGVSAGARPRGAGADRGPAPGSRPNELRLILPDLAAAARLVAATCPACNSSSPARPALDDALFEPVVSLRSAGNPRRDGRRRCRRCAWRRVTSSSRRQAPRPCKRRCTAGRW
jgi:lipid-A-disaccharide synthase